MHSDDGVIFYSTETVNGVDHNIRFDYSKYGEFRASRFTHTPRNILKHPLIGKRMARNDGVTVIIETVCRHWHFGYYEHIVYRVDGTQSHGTFIAKNFSSIDSTIIEMAEEFKEWKEL